MVPCYSFNSTLDKDSKILILGTLPPCNRSWYYEEDYKMWQIIGQATNNTIKLVKLSKIEKEKLIAQNKIAFWDIFKFAYRVNGSAKDKDMRNMESNNLMQELQEKNARPEIIIVNGFNKKENKISAFKLFKDYNNLSKESHIDEDIIIRYYVWNNIKVYPMRATSAIERLKNKSDIDWENTWIKLLKKYIRIS